MTTHMNAAPVSRRFWTPGAYLLAFITLVGLVAMAQRFFFGLGAATNLSNQYPWGIWKAISVAAGVALATCGFTTAALVHIFHRTAYERITRLALLVGLLGYTFGCVSLAIDIGRYYNIWHPAWPTMWQGDSVLFEVAMCIMSYVTIMYIEFMPILCERFLGRVNLPGKAALLNRPVEAVLRTADRTLGKVLSLFVLVGVVLSCMHHSSLGALMLVAPYKMHPLWYTPVLPLLFLLSVFGVGFAAVIAVSITTDRGIGRKPDMALLAPLSLYVFFFLGVYLIAKVTDLLVREAYGYLFDGSMESLWFFAEFIAGLVVPVAMLAFTRVRRSPALLTTACSLALLGLVLNRINVFLVAYQSAYSTTRYFPSVTELAITGGLIAMFVLVFRLAVSYLPILPSGGVRVRSREAVDAAPEMGGPLPGKAVPEVARG